MLWDIMGISGMQCRKARFGEESEDLSHNIYCALSAKNHNRLRICLIRAGNAGQTACKPGSVLTPSKPGAMDGHSSGTSVAERLARPTRATTRKHRCRLPGVSPLFGLAPGGVCHAASVAGRAVGSYPTVSPLPGWFAARKRANPAVCFLWHFPWGRPRRTLSGTVSPWSPDFPHRRGCPRQRSHPAV